MVRRPIHLALFAFFVGSMTLWGVARGEPQVGSLEPAVQTLDGGAFDQPVQDSLIPKANGSVTREGRVVVAAAPFTHFMVRWEATLTGTEDIAFEARARPEGGEWTPWGVVAHNHDLHDPDAAPDLHWSTTIYAGVAREWQLRVTLTPNEGGPLPVLRSVAVHTLDGRAEDAPDPASADRDGSAFDGRRPAFVPRSAWGGAAVEARSVAPSWHPVTHLVIHHTADANTLVGEENDWGDRVRAEWAFHTYSRGWGDIGYNWLIDPNGIVYEGRKGSSDPARDAVGFHDTANYGSMGVALLGSFGRSARPPTPRAMGTLTYLLAWKAYGRGIDPLGSSPYDGCSRSSDCRRTNPRGAVLNIAGHRQITGATLCPGDLTMAQLGALREDVRRVMTEVGSAPTPEAGTPPSTAQPPAPAATDAPTNTPTPAPTNTPTNTATPTSTPTVTPSPTPSPTPRPRTRLDGQVRWTLANSPVVLTQDHVVAVGASLVVEAGVEVRLGAAVDLFVDGELRAEGTADMPVRFTGDGGRWGGVVGAPGSSIALTHTVVNDAGANGVAVASTEGRLTLLQSTITGNVGGVRGRGAAVEMLGSRVADNMLAQGAAVDLDLGPTEAITLDGNTFDGAGDRAGAALVRIGVGAGGKGALSITNNTWTGGSGPHLELEASAPATGTISCNTFGGGAMGFKLSATTPDASNFALVVEQNAFEGQSVVGAASTVALAAPNNWWGHTTGPADVQRNPAGQGVRVGVNVAFAPVLAEVPGCGG